MALIFILIQLQTVTFFAKVTCMTINFSAWCLCCVQNSPTDSVDAHWYHAPELLLRLCDVTSAVDLWSVGCIVAEMLIGQPMFRGQTPRSKRFVVNCGSKGVFPLKTSSSNSLDLFLSLQCFDTVAWVTLSAEKIKSRQIGVRSHWWKGPFSGLRLQGWNKPWPRYGLWTIALGLKGKVSRFV